MLTQSGNFSPAYPDAALSETPAPVLTPPPGGLRPASPPTGGPLLRRRIELRPDPRLVGPLVAQLCTDLLAAGICGARIANHVGVALEEAILNAIYHGNLEISSELKENGDEPFHAKVRERQGLAPYCHRLVRLASRVTPERATFVIADEGPGFDVASLPDPTDPENLLKPSGRGLLLMRAFMDTVRYNATGNSVMMVKLRCEDDEAPPEE